MTSTSRQIDRQHWVRIVIQWMLLCFLGFYTLAIVPHQHASLTDELDCPVHHVAGHQAVDVSPAGTLPAFAVLVFWLLLSLLSHIPYVLNPRGVLPPLRGPPFFS